MKPPMALHLPRRTLSTLGSSKRSQDQYEKKGKEQQHELPTKVFGLKTVHPKSDLDFDSTSSTCST